MPVAIGIAIWLIVRFGHREIVRNLLLATLVGAAAAALSGVISYYPPTRSRPTSGSRCPRTP